MTKKEIVKTISEEIGMTQLVTKEIVQKTFDAIIETLVAEGRIELRNFGVFEVKKRKSRKARNPKTGDPVEVSEKFVVTFKPGKEMEERVRQHGSVPPPETASASDGQPKALERSVDGFSEAPRDGRPMPSPNASEAPAQSNGHSADSSAVERRPESAYFGSRGSS